MIVALAMIAVSAAAQAQQCPPPPTAPSLRMTTELPPPSYRHALSKPRIGALARHGYMSNDKRHAGLTQAKTEFKVTPQLSIRTFADGSACIYLGQVDASWRMTMLLVDIAVEYSRASCPYAEIWRHENQHVAISQRHFMTADRALRDELGKLARAFRPVAVQGSARQTADKIRQSFLEVARPVLDRYQKDSERDNRAIDTPESYRAVGDRCTDW